MSTILYGASDDLIELEGELSEEFSAYGFDGYLAFSDGTVISCRYRSTWDFALVVGDPSQVTITPPRGEAAGPDADGVPGYSGKVILPSGLNWVALVRESGDLVRR